MKVPGSLASQTHATQATPLPPPAHDTLPRAIASPPRSIQAYRAYHVVHYRAWISPRRTTQLFVVATAVSFVAAFLTAVAPGTSVVVLSGAYCLTDMRLRTSGAVFSLFVGAASCTLFYLYSSMFRSVRAVRRAAPRRQSDTAPCVMPRRNDGGATRGIWRGAGGARVWPVASRPASVPPLLGLGRGDGASVNECAAGTPHDAADSPGPSSASVCTATSRGLDATSRSEGGVAVQGGSCATARLKVGPTDSPSALRSDRSEQLQLPPQHHRCAPLPPGSAAAPATWNVGRVALTLTAVFCLAWAPTMAMAVAVQVTEQLVPPAVDIFAGAALHVCFIVSAAVQVRLHRAYRRELARVVAWMWTASGMAGMAGGAAAPHAPAPCPAPRRYAATIATARASSQPADADLEDGRNTAGDGVPAQRRPTSRVQQPQWPRRQSFGTTGEPPRDVPATHDAVPMGGARGGPDDVGRGTDTASGGGAGAPH